VLCAIRSLLVYISLFLSLCLCLCLSLSLCLFPPPSLSLSLSVSLCLSLSLSLSSRFLFMRRAAGRMSRVSRRIKSHQSFLRMFLLDLPSDIARGWLRGRAEKVARRSRNSADNKLSAFLNTEPVCRPRRTSRWMLITQRQHTQNYGRQVHAYKIAVAH